MEGNHLPLHPNPSWYISLCWGLSGVCGEHPHAHLLPSSAGPTGETAIGWASVICSAVLYRRTHSCWPWGLSASISERSTWRSRGAAPLPLPGGAGPACRRRLKSLDAFQSGSSPGGVGTPCSPWVSHGSVSGGVGLLASTAIAYVAGAVRAFPLNRSLLLPHVKRPMGRLAVKIRPSMAAVCYLMAYGIAQLVMEPFPAGV